MKRYDLEPSYDAVDGYEASLQMEECPDGDYVLASDFDALNEELFRTVNEKNDLIETLSDRHAHALAVERGKLEKADAENQRLRDRVRELEAEVRHLGDIGDVCTYDILKNVCDRCQCNRKHA